MPGAKPKRIVAKIHSYHSNISFRARKQKGLLPDYPNRIDKTAARECAAPHTKLLSNYPTFCQQFDPKACDAANGSNPLLENRGQTRANRRLGVVEKETDCRPAINLFLIIVLTWGYVINRFYILAGTTLERQKSCFTRQLDHSQSSICPNSRVVFQQDPTSGIPARQSDSLNHPCCRKIKVNAQNMPIRGTFKAKKGISELRSDLVGQKTPGHKFPAIKHACQHPFPTTPNRNILHIVAKFPTR